MSARLPGARVVLWALLALDLVVFGGWIGFEEVPRRTGTQVLLPIEGQDPRDLLAGHYLQIRLLASREAFELKEASDAGRKDYCIEPGAGGLWHVVRMRRAADPCPTFLRSEVDANGWPEFGIDRFYIDERLPNTRFSARPDAYLVARVDRWGGAHAIDVVVHGASLRTR